MNDLTSHISMILQRAGNRGGSSTCISTRSIIDQTQNQAVASTMQSMVSLSYKIFLLNYKKFARRLCCAWCSLYVVETMCTYQILTYFSPEIAGYNSKNIGEK